MNYETAIELAHQRMKEIGKHPCEYHIDVLSVVGTAKERENGHIEFKAYNEYLYLIDYLNYYGLLILSDSAFFHADDYTYNTKLQEFTGDIKILKIADSWSIENGLIASGTKDRKKPLPVDFIRVVIH